jgi:Ribbon-helix-helix protein, copG family
MQKTLSTRIDESVYDMVDQIAIKKKMSKPEIIEEAIKHLWEMVLIEKNSNPFETSFGSWDRDESVDETVRKSRDAFNQSMHRHHK